MSVDMDMTRHERAHQYWLSLLSGRAMPTIADLTAESLSEFKNHSFLIAIAGQGKSPVVSFAGKEIFAGVDAPALKAGTSLDTVAGDSLLALLSNEFTQIQTSCEPLEFLTNSNSADASQTFSATLMPFGSSGAVQFIWGVLSDPQAEPEQTSVEVDNSFDEPADDGMSFGGGSDGSSSFDEVLSEDISFEEEEAFEPEIDSNKEDESFSERERLSGFDVYADTFENEAYELSEVSTVERSDLGTGNVPADTYLGFDDRADTFEGEAYELAEVVTDEGAIVFYDEDTGFDTDTQPDTNDGFAGSIAEVGEGSGFDGFAGDVAISEPVKEPELDEPVEEIVSEDDEGSVEESFTSPEEELDESELDAQSEQVLETEPEEEVPFFNVLADGRTAADGVVHVDQRSRLSLYDVLEKAYALYEESLSDRETYLSILKATGIREQARAPFTPIIKLVFGKDFDKTRITEYAAALSFAKRNGQNSETISGFLANHPGGIKGCVQAERVSKREDRGIVGDVVLEKAKEKLRAEPAIAEVNINLDGDDEFVLLLGRKGSNNGVVEIVKSIDDKKSFVDPVIKRTVKQ